MRHALGHQASTHWLPAPALPQVGNCGSECKTVQLAAERIMGEHDTDIAEILFTVCSLHCFGPAEGLPAALESQHLCAA